MRNDCSGLASHPEGAIKPLYCANRVCTWIGMDLIVKNRIYSCTLDSKENVIFVVEHAINPVSHHHAT